MTTAGRASGRHILAGASAVHHRESYFRSRTQEETIKGANISVIVLAKNEATAIYACVRSASFVSDDIVVVDSHSVDSTGELAENAGARVVKFAWNGRYPKKKEWSLQHAGVRHPWVLMLDADERVTPDLAAELLAAARSGSVEALDIPIAYYWRGRRLRFGQTVFKRAFFRSDAVTYPHVLDLEAPGITEVEGHYQPQVHGRVERSRFYLEHDDPDPISDWYARHNRYSDWEAYLRTHRRARASVRRARSQQGRVFDLIPLKPVVIFLYNFVFKWGFLDGRHGFEYALSLAYYQFQISVKVREFTSAKSRTHERGQPPVPSVG